jgi:multidrug resistance efflux pump
VRAAAVLALTATATWVAAHEGHNTVAERPVYRQVQAANETYRIGLALLPADPVIGEDVRLEMQVLELPGADDPPDHVHAVGSADVTVQIISTSAEPYTLPHVGPGEKPGTYTARHRFADSGQYAIAVKVPIQGQSIAAEFPVVVSSGPVTRTAVLLDAGVLLVLGALAYSRVRTRRAAGGAASPVQDGALLAVGLVALIGAHTAVGPRLGRLFLPERHFGPIAWDSGHPDADAPPAGAPAETPHVDPPGTPPHTHPPGTPPHTHSGGEAAAARPEGAHDIVSTVIPAPGQLVEVMVPASARVLFEGFTPRVGASVKRGQTIATLEYNYILHDAVHLINQRWLYLVPMLAARRASLEAELTAARTHYLAAHGDAPVQQAMQVMHAAESADLAAVTAAKDYDRAQKLLAMHSAQISQSSPVRRPVVSPIDGVIEAVNFAHGELKYENDRLFTILDLSRVSVEVRFPDDAASRQPPAHMRFVAPAFPEIAFEGRLARVANTLDPATGTLSAFFDVPNPQRLLRIGMRLSAAPADGSAARAADGAVLRNAAATRVAAPLRAPRLELVAAIQPKPELKAEVAAPLWGRIEFAGRRLNVGDVVKKGDDLAQVILELAADERYQMNARRVDISAERDLAKARREQAEKRWSEGVAALKASPDDPFRKAEMAILDRIRESARDEESLLGRQAEAYDETMKRRDPKITIVKAPISGVITEIGFKPGELNGTDEFRRLFTIVNTSSVWLQAQAYDDGSAAVLRGFTRASFTSPALAQPRPLGRPAAISGSVDPETGALRVIFDVPNPGGALKIGGSAQILIDRD